MLQVSPDQAAAHAEQEREAKKELEDRYRAVFGGCGDTSDDEDEPPF